MMGGEEEEDPLEGDDCGIEDSGEDTVKAASSKNRKTGRSDEPVEKRPRPARKAAELAKFKLLD